MSVIEASVIIIQLKNEESQLERSKCRLDRFIELDAPDRLIQDEINIYIERLIKIVRLKNMLNF